MGHEGVGTGGGRYEAFRPSVSHAAFVLLDLALCHTQRHVFMFPAVAAKIGFCNFYSLS